MTTVGASSAGHISSRTLTTPRGAAIAGVIFSALMITAICIVRIAAAGSTGADEGLAGFHPDAAAYRIAPHLATIAGVAFLWMMGVLRNRLGALEDRFFATVFLGSGLLFVASLFAASTLLAALRLTAASGRLHEPDVYWFALYASQGLLNVCAIKMAAVFTFSTCTIALRTGILHRWIIYTGFACGLVLLLVITSWRWISLLFPSWILLVSSQILVTEHRTRGAPGS